MYPIYRNADETITIKAFENKTRGPLESNLEPHKMNIDKIQSDLTLMFIIDNLEAFDFFFAVNLPNLLTRISFSKAFTDLVNSTKSLCFIALK